ncbi:MAG: flagellar basal-body rod protein FlgG [Planctomycetaceae bacterium]|nr:Flagellar basal-body rod protein FlgG [Planctomycetota bacterium]NUO15203.1 flagellar basal-body rod protein FlgG [Planctomycetaceae bacterium]HRJ79682.1 flagellar basal-body rod protein FlgG [Planctomycetota bacterium]
MAIRALHTASSGMSALQTQVDVIANNLANVNTVGFKQDRANFADLLYQEVRRAGLRQPEGNTAPVGLSIGSGVKLDSIDKEFRQGGMRVTGNNFDMAIEGDGFFQILMFNGQTAYTRSGNLFRDKDGNLVTAGGLKLQPNITIPAEATGITVSEDGRISAIMPGQSNADEIGQIELARFVNPKGLQAIGDNLFLETDASGRAETGSPTTSSFGRIRHQALEESNVEVVKEMVDLISAQRAYEINANAIKSADEMMRVANNLRA